VRALVPADFDGDGIPDLLVLELFEIDVLKGNGDGTFRGASFYAPATGYPEVAAVADFNRDGKPDIVIAIQGLSPRLEVLLGNGNGTFQPPISAPGTTPLTTLAVGDFNGDTLPDVAGIFRTNGTAAVLVFLGVGSGQFAAPVSYPSPVGSQAIALGDFNRDGKLDMAVASYGDLATVNHPGGSLVLFPGKGDGTFLPAAAVPLGSDNPQVSTVTAADFNRDGFLDLAVVVGTRLMTLLGRGDGTFRTAATDTLAVSVIGAYDLIPADLNGDGILDLIRTDQAIWRLGNGDGTFQPETPFGTGAYPLFTATAAADFNRDGKLDLAGGLFTTGVVTELNISQPSALTVVNAASFAAGPLAPDSIATAFGTGLAGASVTVAGTPASVFYSSPHQVNFLIPAGLPTGQTTTNINGVSTPIQIAPVSPALFVQDATALAAAYVQRPGRPIEPVTNPITFGPPDEQVFLILFGTGIRGTPQSGVRVRIQGIDVPVVYAGAQPQYPGLDQVNVRLPPSLAGLGEVSIVLTANGIDSPTVHVSTN
jgi:uncharacterized protein (TIGR03437 family)